MRNSKLFLIGTLVCVTIAAVAAAKGMKGVLPHYYYQKGNMCVFVNSAIRCVPGSPTCKYVEGSNQYQEYAERLAPTICNNPIEPEGFDGTKLAETNAVFNIRMIV